ncbi:hypothetical protein AA3266_1949 [Gluconobacter kondonii NBRC 3266]|nr:hypothetical protein AA3266_1949 [Gluconobacter kondonii NBRC 3266]
MLRALECSDVGIEPGSLICCPVLHARDTDDTSFRQICLNTSNGLTDGDGRDRSGRAGREGQKRAECEDPHAALTSASSASKSSPVGAVPGMPSQFSRDSRP